MFVWMAWTTPTAAFFITIGLMLCFMTLWEIRSPTSLQKGFLPMETTRGDRLFIGLVTMAYTNLAFVGISGKIAEVMSLEVEPSIWIGFVISLFLLVTVMRKG
jgi:predicted small integral membrane protein